MPQPYTTPPKYGDKGPTVKAYQDYLNDKYGKVSGYKALSNDAIFGPNTLASSKFDTDSTFQYDPGIYDPNIVSTTKYRSDLSNYKSDLGKLGTENDPYMALFTKMNEASDANLKKENKSISLKYGEQQKGAEEDYAAYEAGLKTLGIQSGLSRYAPSLQADRMINAKVAHRKRIEELQSKEELAFANAKQADLDNDLSTLKEQTEYVKSIRKEKAQAIDDELNRKGKELDIAEKIAPYVYSQLQGLSEDQKEDFLLRISEEYGISPAALLGTASTYHIKSKKTSGNSGGYSALELRKLRQAGIDPSDTDKADDFLYADVVPASPEDFTEDSLRESYSTGQLYKLARNLQELNPSFSVEHDRNFTRQDEINQLFEHLPGLIDSLIEEGFGKDEISAELEKYM